MSADSKFEVKSPLLSFADALPPSGIVFGYLSPLSFSISNCKLLLPLLRNKHDSDRLLGSIGQVFEKEEFFHTIPMQSLGRPQIVADPLRTFWTAVA
jgi:hypothetical protein